MLSQAETVSRYKILIVQADAALRVSLSEQLAQEAEFDPIECDGIETALATMRHRRCDAILLDSDPPETAGCDACRALRAAHANVPIVLMLATNGAAATAHVAAAGADEHICKPIRLSVLLTRLRALLTAESRPAPTLNFGPYVFEPANKRLIERRGKRSVRLTEKETAILKYLHQAGGRAIGREILLSEVWGYREGVTTHTLETHVYRLRKKIERDPAQAEILVTAPGGYRLLQ